jgi:hypothetical protein
MRRATTVRYPALATNLIAPHYNVSSRARFLGEGSAFFPPPPRLERPPRGCRSEVPYSYKSPTNPNPNDTRLI